MRAVIALVALLLLSGQGFDPLAPSSSEKPAAAGAPAAEAPLPPGAADPAGTLPSNPKAAAPAPIGTVSPADPAAAKTAKPGAKDAKAGAAAAGPKQPEVLPWTNAPKVVPGAAGAPPVGADKTAAVSPCTGLIEAGCRDEKKKCAWVAEMKTEDGTVVPGRCAARTTAPVKKAQAAPAAKPKPKPAADAAAKAVTAPSPAVADPSPPPTAEAPPAAPAAKPGTPGAPVIITVNPPKAENDPAAAEGIPRPATE